jgi:hypothetical protein
MDSKYCDSKNIADWTNKNVGIFNKNINIFFIFKYLSFLRAIRNLYDQVLIHQGKVIDKTKDVDLDSQLKKVLEFLIDLTAIINELNREFRCFQFTRSQSLSDIKQNVGDVRRTYSSGIQRMAELNTIKL